MGLESLVEKNKKASELSQKFENLKKNRIKKSLKILFKIASIYENEFKEEVIEELVKTSEAYIDLAVTVLTNKVYIYKRLAEIEARRSKKRAEVYDRYANILLEDLKALKKRTNYTAIIQRRLQKTCDKIRRDERNAMFDNLNAVINYKN